METQTLTSANTAPKVAARALRDTQWVQLQLVEGSTPGKVVLRGEFARCGVATENKRVYPQRLWEREITRLGRPMKEHSLYGELDHPSDGRTQLSRASHKITNLEIKDGLVYGEAEVMDTSRGRDLKAILQSGGKVGISSRGYGSTRTNEKGEEVVQEDYRLVTFDFVADPADQHAFPEVFYEHKEGSMGEREDDAKMAEEFARRLEAAKREGAEGREASLRDEFKRETLNMLATMRSEVTEQVRGELLSDPAVAGARTALNKIKDVLRPFVLPEDAKTVQEQKDSEIAALNKQIQEQGLQLRDLQAENAKLAEVAKEAGYKYFIERQIAGDPDADLVRKLIGDPKRYASSDELKTKIESVRTELAAKREREQKLQEQIEAEKAEDAERKEKERGRALKAERSLREENDQLRAALDKSLVANKQLMLQVYTEGRVRNHPQGERIRGLVESSNPQSKKDVDEIISQFRESAPSDPEELEGVRARVRRLTKGGHGPTPIEEEAPSKGSRRGSAGPFGDLGVSLEEMKTLAGMPEDTRGPVSRHG
jgi:hypothetical protein